MNNVCGERISLTYQMFAFIHLFPRVAAERGCNRRFHPPQQAESGFLAICLFQFCFDNVSFFRLGESNETDSSHKGKP